MVVNILLKLSLHYRKYNFFFSDNKILHFPLIFCQKVYIYERKI
mgnify:CR=1 FL=1